MTSKIAVTIEWILVIVLCGGCGSQLVLPGDRVAQAGTESPATNTPVTRAPTEVPASTQVVGETVAPTTTPEVANGALTANDLMGLWAIPPDSEERLTTITWIQLLIIPQFPGQIILSRAQGKRQGELHNELVNYELHDNQIAFHTGDSDETYAVAIDGDEMTLSNGLTSLTYCNLRPRHEGVSHCAGWPTETP